MLDRSGLATGPFWAVRLGHSASGGLVRWLDGLAWARLGGRGGDTFYLSQIQLAGGRRLGIFLVSPSQGFTKKKTAVADMGRSCGR